MNERRAYPSDVTNDEWAFVAPHLTLKTEAAAPREHPLREVFYGMRWIIHAGAPWRMMPNDLPPWPVVYQQTQRRLKAAAPSLRPVSLTVAPSSPHRRVGCGYNDAKRKKDSKVHLAVDTLGHLLALYLTPTNEQDRA